MPVWPNTSPAVVMVRMPAMKSVGSPGHRLRVPADTARAPVHGRRCSARVSRGVIGRLEPAGMLHARPDAVEPGALVGAARRGERRAGKLLGIEPVGRSLRRIAALRQRARQALGFEIVAETRHVGKPMVPPSIDARLVAAVTIENCNLNVCNHQCRRGLWPTEILDLEDFLPYRLNRLADAVSRDFSRIYRERHGLTRPEWRRSLRLGQYGTMTATEIGAIRQCTRPRSRRAVRELEKRRWLTRFADAGDRRVEHLALTKAGLRLQGDGAGGEGIRGGIA